MEITPKNLINNQSDRYIQITKNPSRSNDR